MDTQETIKCPACGCEMKKVYSDKAKVFIDICTEGCGGVFFDNRELEKFDESHENAEVIFNALGNKEFQPVDESLTRTCPACNAPMVKMGSGKGAVEIDVCNTCGGKFLDNGELQKIREGVKQEDGFLNGFIDSVWEDAKPSPRREFFENIVKKML